MFGELGCFVDTDLLACKEALDRVTFASWLDGRLAADVYLNASDAAQATAIKNWLRERTEVEAVLPGGRADDMPRPGDYLTFDRLGDPIVIVRGRDSTLRAFANTCQHRGAPVVRDVKGHARTLRCQYHSWSYDIDDGRLVHVPDERDFVDLDKSIRCLPTLRCEVWDGWVFVNHDPQAPPLLQWRRSLRRRTRKVPNGANSSRRWPHLTFRTRPPSAAWREGAFTRVA